MYGKKKQKKNDFIKDLWQYPAGSKLSLSGSTSLKQKTSLRQQQSDKACPSSPAVTHDSLIIGRGRQHEEMWEEGDPPPIPNTAAYHVGS